MDRDTITRTGTRTPGVEQSPARTEVHQRTAFPGPRTGIQRYRQRGARRTEANARREELADDGKAPSDIPALKPKWGKPALRNFRGDHGNGGIIRSPIRAMVPPGRTLFATPNITSTATPHS